MGDMMDENKIQATSGVEDWILILLMLLFGESADIVKEYAKEGKHPCEGDGMETLK